MSGFFLMHFLKKCTEKALVPKAKSKKQNKNQSLKLHQYCKNKTRCWGINTVPEKPLRMILTEPCIFEAICPL